MKGKEVSLFVLEFGFLSVSTVLYTQEMEAVHSSA